MRIGLPLRLRYEVMADLAVLADELGFESIWLPDHLALPLGSGSATGVEHDPIDSAIPILDTWIVLDRLATLTRRVKVGTWVYNLALRHPLVAARQIQTVDLGSGGRVLLGVGAGWIPGEYAAAGVDFASRGRRLEECVGALRVLFAEDRPEFHGDHVRFGPVSFEPKPPRRSVPILVGGESRAALARAARIGDGWIGGYHDLASAAEQVRTLRECAAQVGRDPSTVEVTVAATPSTIEEAEAYRRAGVDRLLVSPWRGSSDAVTAVARWARDFAGFAGLVD